MMAGEPVLAATKPLVSYFGTAPVPQSATSRFSRGQRSATASNREAATVSDTSPPTFLCRDSSGCRWCRGILGNQLRGRC